MKKKFSAILLSFLMIGMFGMTASASSDSATTIEKLAQKALADHILFVKEELGVEIGAGEAACGVVKKGESKPYRIYYS